jgi:hypothetical protein
MVGVLGSPDDKARQRLALIEQLWRELRSARKDAEKQDALMKRIRQEADAFRQALRLGHDDKS